MQSSALPHRTGDKKRAEAIHPLRDRTDQAPGYEELRRLNAEREALLNINRAIGRHLDRDELFGALAVCLQAVMPAERFGIELPVEGCRLKGHILTPQRDIAQPTTITYLPAAGTACDWVLQNHDWVVVGAREELRDRFPITFRVMTEQNMESLCALPLVTDGHSRGALFFMKSAVGAYRELSRALLEQVASAVAVALDDCLAHEEVRRLRDQLAAENAYLQEEIRSEHNFTEIIGESPALLKSLRKIEQVAATQSTVLLLGETGTGKELFARAIHDRSERKSRPLVKVNCGAISAGLVESELFGHVRGAFTGALANRDGRFKLADGGTLFLDEVSELPAETQVKLLRVLQEQEFEPIGSSRTIRVNVRIIAASNRDLEQCVGTGKLRADLFYRLNVFPIHVPPLRKRASDIPLLAFFFHAEVCAQGRKRDQRDFAREHCASGQLPVAGQHPRIAERNRTRGHSFTGSNAHFGRGGLPSCPWRPAGRNNRISAARPTHFPHRDPALSHPIHSRADFLGDRR